MEYGSFFGVEIDTSAIKGKFKTAVGHGDENTELGKAFLGEDEVSKAPVHSPLSISTHHRQHWV